MLLLWWNFSASVKWHLLHLSSAPYCAWLGTGLLPPAETRWNGWRRRRKCNPVRAISSNTTCFWTTWLKLIRIPAFPAINRRKVLVCTEKCWYALKYLITTGRSLSEGACTLFPKLIRAHFSTIRLIFGMTGDHLQMLKKNVQLQAPAFLCLHPQNRFLFLARFFSVLQAPGTVSLRSLSCLTNHKLLIWWVNMVPLPNFMPVNVNHCKPSLVLTEQRFWLPSRLQWILSKKEDVAFIRVRRRKNAIIAYRGVSGKNVFAS